MQDRGVDAVARAQPVRSARRTDWSRSLRRTEAWPSWGRSRWPPAGPRRTPWRRLPRALRRSSPSSRPRRRRVPVRSAPAAGARGRRLQPRRPGCPLLRRRRPACSCGAPAWTRGCHLVEDLAFPEGRLAVVLDTPALPQAVEHLVLAGGAASSSALRAATSASLSLQARAHGASGCASIRSRKACRLCSSTAPRRALPARPLFGLGALAARPRRCCSSA